MSFNRENVIWQSRDGSWNRGFYTVHSSAGGGDDEYYDPEWDVEYDYGSFEWVSTGHLTQEKAWDSWDGANPGGADMRVPGDGNDAEDVELLDDLAYIHQQQEKARGEEMRGNGWGYRGYGGFGLGGARRASSHEMKRPASRLAKRYYDGKMQLLRARIDGVSGGLNGHAIFMGEKLRERLENGELSAEELEQVAGEEKRFQREGRVLIDEATKHVRERRGKPSYHSEFYYTSPTTLKAAEDELSKADELSKLARRKLREKRAEERDERGSAPVERSRSNGSGEATTSGERKPYHINPETGRANICRASKQTCRFAVDGKEPPHYSTKEEARAAYEKSRSGDAVPRGVKRGDHG